MGAGTGWLPPWSALGLAAAPLVIPAARAVTSGATGARLVPALVGTARLMALTGALLAVGVLV